MLKKLFQLLNLDLTRKTWTEEAHHPYFGKMILFGFEDRPDSYWECELKLDGRTIGVAVNAPHYLPPGDSEVAFAQQILSDIDVALERVAGLLKPEYEKLAGASAAEDWKQAFVLEGMTVPVGGNATAPWELSFSERFAKAGHLWTCYFQDGSPRHLTMDD